MGGSFSDLDNWLKGSIGIGDYDCVGILRCAQDDSKNKQRQEQKGNGKNRGDGYSRDNGNSRGDGN
jgi:hypothetical protein